MEFENYLEGICKLALSMPSSSLYYAMPNNLVRRFLLELADCIKAAAMAKEDMKKEEEQPT